MPESVDATRTYIHQYVPDTKDTHSMMGLRTTFDFTYVAIWFHENNLTGGETRFWLLMGVGSHRPVTCDVGGACFRNERSQALRRPTGGTTLFCPGASRDNVANAPRIPEGVFCRSASPSMELVGKADSMGIHSTICEYPRLPVLEDCPPACSAGVRYRQQIDAL